MFQISPGVVTAEIDLTATVPAPATRQAGIAGLFRWGPINVVTEIVAEHDLVNKFGKPTTYNAETFFSAANFLAYSNLLYVVRCANTTDSNVGVLTAVANVDVVANLTPFIVKNRADYDEKSVSFTSSDTDVKYIAKYPGELGNSLKISVCDSAAAYEANLALAVNSSVNSSISVTKFDFLVGDNTATVTIQSIVNSTVASACMTTAVLNNLIVGDILQTGNSTVGKQSLKVTSISSVTTNAAAQTASVSLGLETKVKLRDDWTAQTVKRNWEYYASVDRAPGQSVYLKNLGSVNGNTSANDQLHAIVVDENGLFTGVPGQIIEIFSGLSRITSAKTADGATNYYVNILNNNSRYIWWAEDRDNAASANATAVISSTNTKPLTLSFVGGQDGDDEAATDVNILLDGWDQFVNDQVTVSLLIAGKARGADSETQVANYIIDNLCEVRKDCVAFISPRKSDVVGQSAFGDEVDNLISFRDSVTNSSYAVLDSGYKYQYDRYNDIYRWIPLNGDIAGLTARTDHDRDPWFSPAGLTRGIIKNSIKLAFNPNLADRDRLYPKDINPVVTFPGEGTLLYGDKTLLGHDSAFSRINVRRLFIILEVAIARAAKLELFELNDDFTRAQFVNLVEPFLRDVQGRHGITDFKVVCNETNNTPEVIDTNRFIGDIYIKPARSINFILLNFIATRTGVDFSELVNPGRN
jgi:phage tail sheath protein FI